MMHCKACDCLLTDKESSRRSITTGEYLDLCDKDYKSIADQVPTIVNHNLANEIEENEDDEYS